MIWIAESPVTSKNLFKLILCPNLIKRPGTSLWPAGLFIPWSQRLLDRFPPHHTGDHLGISKVSDTRSDEAAARGWHDVNGPSSSQRDRKYYHAHHHLADSCPSPRGHTFGEGLHFLLIIPRIFDVICVAFRKGYSSRI